LNASYAFGLTEDDIRQSFLQGKPVAQGDPLELGELFIDARPNLIMRAMRESGATAQSVTALYRALVNNGSPRVLVMDRLISEWENQCE